MMREEPVGEPKPKSFEISKWAVWEAYRRVKANKGAAGVDGESIQEFERDLHGNLYKLWNRLSSGSYMPPPVRVVEIPKKDGSPRVLGVPTVADRIAQTVVRGYLEPNVEPMFHEDSYGYRPGRWEPDELRGSRPVLRAPGGAIPPATHPITCAPLHEVAAAGAEGARRNATRRRVATT